MALADVYELRVSGEIHDQPWNCVFHALRASAGYDAQAVADAFGDSVLGNMKDAVPTAVSFLELSVKNLGDPLDFYEVSVAPLAGQRAGESMGPFVSTAVRFTRKRTDMHHGYKRLPGCSESDQASGTLAAGLVTELQAFADDVIASWEDNSAPGTAVCNFIVVKRVLEDGKYRLPKTDGELVYYVPDSYSVVTRLTSQNSRKVGR